MPLPTPALSLKGRALRLLSQREHSRLELERKLRRHEQQPGELGRALDELQARGFIDEQRVLESVLHRRAGRLGAARVRQEMLALGLEAGAVRQAVGELQATEGERALEAWRKKFGAAVAADPEAAGSAAARAKQTRFLAARGFGAAAIAQVLRQQHSASRTRLHDDDDAAQADAGLLDDSESGAASGIDQRASARPRSRGL